MVAGIIAALIASAIRRSTQRQFDNQTKAQKDLYEEQVRTLRSSLHEQQEQQQATLTRFLAERPEAPPAVALPAAPVDNGQGPDVVALRERLATDKNARGANLRQALLLSLIHI